MKSSFVSLVLAAIIGAVPLSAHHSFAAEFDREAPFKVTGTVSKIEWTNPHIWIFVDVKEADGKVTTWEFQGGPPSYLTRAGWNKTDLKPGDTVSIQGFKAKDGSHHAAGGAVTLPDGRRIFALQIEGLPQQPAPSGEKNEKK
jgi:uncharacterized protein DUF6152